VLVLLSVVLTASVLYPDISGETIVAILGGGVGAALILTGVTLFFIGQTGKAQPALDRALRPNWRMRPLHQLAPNRITGTTRVWMIVLRGYLLVAIGMVLFRLVQLAMS